MQPTMEGDNWNMIEMRESSYLINEVESVDADDILSYSSSDADDQTHAKRKIDGNGIIVKREVDEAVKMLASKPLKVGKALKARIRKEYILKTLIYLILFAGILNLLLLGGFLRQVGNFVKTHDVNCPPDTNLFSSTRCNIEEYLGHLAYHYRKTHNHAVYDTGIVNTHKLKSIVTSFHNSLQTNLQNTHQQLLQSYHYHLAPHIARTTSKLRPTKSLAVHYWHQKIHPYLRNASKNMHAWFAPRLHCLFHSFRHNLQQSLALLADSAVSTLSTLSALSKSKPNLKTSFTTFSKLKASFTNTLSNEYRKILDVLKIKPSST